MSDGAAAMLESQGEWVATKDVVAGDITQRPSISVLGLGYVGAVSVACFANLGFRMVGADVVEAKAEAIQAGVSPIVEEGLETLLRDGVSRGLIEATTDVEDGLSNTLLFSEVYLAQRVTSSTCPSLKCARTTSCW